LASLVSNDSKFHCKNEEQVEAALFEITYHNVWNSDCSKPCSIVQYTGKLDTFDNFDSYPDDSTFTLNVRFAPPVNVTVFEEYLIYDVFDLIGSVGGTLGIFIGFSCTCILSIITDMCKKCPFRISME
jgi:hypothetical protein